MTVTVNKNSIEIVSTISEDEKSQVYLGLDSNKEFAILKIQLGDDRSLLYQRIQQISSPYLPQIYEIEYKDNNTYVVEEYLEGSLLNSVLEKELSRSNAAHYMKELLKAVSVLHNLNPPLIHRDIKPENIIITNDNKLKLLDFDAVREFRGEDCNQDTRMLGTKGYAAPEQYGFSQTDERSDIYSIGIVCREIADKTAFSRTQKKHLNKVLDKATMFDPAKRYKDTGAFLTAINNAYAFGRRIALHIAGFVLLAMIVAAIAFFIKGDEDTKTVEVSKTAEASKTTDSKEYIDDYSLERSMQKNEEYYGFDILPDDYSFTTIAYECANNSEYIKESLNDFEIHFYKANPQALFFYDQSFEEATVTETSLSRFSNDGQTFLEKLKFPFDEGCKLEYGFLYIPVEKIEKLNPGYYELSIDGPKDFHLNIELSVYDYDIRTSNGVPDAPSSVQYYSKSRQNMPVFTILSTTSTILEVKSDGELISDYELTKDGKGAVFYPEYLDQFDVGKTVNLSFALKSKDIVDVQIVIIP